MSHPERMRAPEPQPSISQNIVHDYHDFSGLWQSICIPKKDKGALPNFSNSQCDLNSTPGEGTRPTGGFHPLM
jgi:hypothetical protein